MNYKRKLYTYLGEKKPPLLKRLFNFDEFKDTFGLRPIKKFETNKKVTYLKRGILAVSIASIFTFSCLTLNYILNQPQHKYKTESHANILKKRHVKQLPLSNPRKSDVKTLDSKVNLSSYKWVFEQDPENWVPISVNVFHNDKKQYISIHTNRNGDYLAGVKVNGKWVYTTPDEKIEVNSDNIQVALFEKQGKTLRVIASSKGIIKDNKTAFERLSYSESSAYDTTKFNHFGDRSIDYQNKLFRSYVASRMHNDNKSRLMYDFGNNVLNEISALYNEGYAPYKIAKLSKYAAIQKTEDVYEALWLLKNNGNDIQINNKRWKLRQYIKNRNNLENQLYGLL